jgi:RNA polymerase sigma-70 factor, ECF subfamily
MPDDPETRAMNLELAVRAAAVDAPEVRAKDDLDLPAAKPGALAMDEASFRAFHEQTARPLLAYLVRACGDRALAEDIWQEAYCRFLTAHAPAMDERRARSYLFQIATNLMRDKWRRRKEEPLTDDTPEPTSPAPNLEGKIELRQAFQRLKPRERQLLWLAYVEGSNHKEIAACTGVKAASIRLLLFRARRKLADFLRTESGREIPR